MPHFMIMSYSMVMEGHFISHKYNIFVERVLDKVFGC